ncbi:MAG: hypothetical protein MJZ21_00180 [archaeon]|nr:hypothetical protein [archaeon]
MSHKSHEYSDNDRNWSTAGYRFEMGNDIMRDLVRKNGTDYRYKEIFASL